MNRQTYAQWGQEALDIIQRGTYTAPSGKEVNIKEAVESSVISSKLYTPKEVTRIDEQMTPVREQKETVFEVTGETTLEASKRLINEGHKVVCLNFASAKHPGGGFLSGARAQEETLARSSGLYPTIAQMKEMYDFNRKKWGFYSDYMVYSPDVPVFREDGGAFEETPYLVSMITSPAVNASVVMKGNPSQRNVISQKMRARIRKVLAVARANQYDVIVLGAFGCGVFGNSSTEVARLFQEALEDERYKGHFKKVVFAIYEPGKPKNKPAFDQLFGNVNP
ncbi:hypothetical protein JMA_37240 (plasmid) [Jeotgalibacillus malaysiensis]|uniref:Microbial-type PARG catalytic domain-containing protein n=1 Tax=Jeotgalibacillus malaysiensis TaxID=1508404 RepID=A0A0B5AWD6_9BACL|nr:TIGR02452 family protein [Jeotgalibacillus malaysiensis]AJD93042.1 hypothetical protein JMA_37240 [Jeotgalibacillus malaysiensis]